MAVARKAQRRYITCMNRPLKYGLLLLINGLCLYLIVLWCQRHIDLPLLLEQMRAIPSGVVPTTTMLALAVIGCYGLRFALLLRQPIAPSTALVSIGLGLNNILPFRLGDVVHIGVAKAFFGLAAVSFLFVKVLEKLLDLTILLLLGSVMLWQPEFADQPLYISISAIFFAGLVAGILVLRWAYQHRSHPLAKHPLIEPFVHALFELIHMPKKRAIIAISVLLWVLNCTMYGYYFNAALPEYTFTIPDICALVFLTIIAFSLPTLPGAVGVFEAGAVYYLTQFADVGANQALATALVLHLIIAIPQIVLMLLCVTGTWIVRAR